MLRKFIFVFLFIQSVFLFSVEVSFKIGDINAIGINPQKKGISTLYEMVKVKLGNTFVPNELFFEGLVLENNKVINKGICNKTSNMTFMIGNNSCSVSSINLDENGINGTLLLKLAYEFGKSEITIPDFKIKADGKVYSGTASKSAFISIMDWHGELQKITINNNILNAEFLSIALHSIMGWDPLIFPKVAINLANNTITTTKGTQPVTFLSTNGYEVNAESYTLTSTGIMLYGKIMLPDNFGNNTFIEANEGFPLDSNGAIMFSFANANAKTHLTLAGWSIYVIDGAFNSNGLSINTGELDLSVFGCKDRIAFENLIFYPTGEIKSPCTIYPALEFKLKNSIFSLGMMKLVIDNLDSFKISGVVSLGESFNDEPFYFDSLLIKPDGSLSSQSTIDEQNFNIGPNIAMQMIRFDNKGLNVSHMYITLPDYFDSINIGVNDFYINQTGNSETDYGVDPFRFWGFHLYLDSFKLDKNAFSATGTLRLPYDFYIPNLQDRRLYIKQFAFDFNTRKVTCLLKDSNTALDIQLPNGWNISGKKIIIEKNKLLIQDAVVKFTTAKEQKAVTIAISTDKQFIDFNDKNLNALYNQ